VGGVGVFGDGGFDGFLGNGARVAQVNQGGEGVVAGCSVVRSACGGGDGCGEVVEFVFEFEDDFLPMPGILVRVAWSPERMALTRRVESIPLKTVMASLGPMPEMVRSFSKRRFSCVSEKPKRAS
jgi:hypothetical protein